MSRSRIPACAVCLIVAALLLILVLVPATANEAFAAKDSAPASLKNASSRQVAPRLRTTASSASMSNLGSEALVVAETVGDDSLILSSASGALPAGTATLSGVGPSSPHHNWNLTGRWSYESIENGTGSRRYGWFDFLQNGTVITGEVYAPDCGSYPVPISSGSFDGATLNITFGPCEGVNHVTASMEYDAGELSGSWTAYSESIPVSSGTYSAWGQETPIPNASQFFGGDACVGNSPCGQAADPISTALGNYTFQEVDLAVPAPGMPLVFRRVYNSQDVEDGSLGRGWRHSYDLTIEDAGDVVTVTVESGARHVYQKIDDPNPDGSTGYMRPFGVFADLVKGSQGYTLTRPYQVQYVFSPGGTLATIHDREGHALIFGYPDSSTTLITDTVGRVYTLTHSVGGYVTELRDPINRTVRYAYTANLLTVITDTRGITTALAYDPAGRLLTMTRGEPELAPCRQSVR